MFEKGKMKGHRFVKGNQTDFVKKKVDRFRLRLEIECKKHGSHSRWRMHSDNNVQCLVCALEWQMNQRRRNPLRFIFRDAKKHALKNKRSFLITLNDLDALMAQQDNKCSLTGTKFDNDNPPSLDRIDSSIGYEIDNLQFILIQVNRMKSDFDQESFIDMCKKIIAYSEAGEKKKKAKKAK